MTCIVRPPALYDLLRSAFFRRTYDKPRGLWCRPRKLSTLEQAGSEIVECLELQLARLALERYRAGDTALAIAEEFRLPIETRPKLDR
jgi:hypothetical protein